MNPWVGISFVLVMLVGQITILRWLKHRYRLHPELMRKLLHIGMGLTALTFPWLFAEIWPVLVLAAITVPGLMLLRHSKQLKNRLGGVIDGVARSQSLGEIYFPLGVVALFILSGGDPLRYTIPILLLALADAVAALIGVYYGHTYYTTAEGYKSVEGSLAFFVVAFFSAYLPLLFWGHATQLTVLLIALILGMLVMLVEAIAWQGLDNLLIPLAGFLLLNAFLEMTLVELSARLVLTLALIVFVLLWRKQANLHDNALLGAALIGYLSWTLADWRWFVGPLIVFIGHIILSFDGKPSDQPAYNIYGVISVAAAGLFWLLLYRWLKRPEFFYPFMLTLAVQLSLLILVARQHSGQTVSIFLLLTSAVTGWLVLFIPFVLLEGLTVATIKYAVMALAGVALAAFLFYRIQPVLNNTYPTDHPRWLRQASCAALGSVVGLLFLYLI